MEKSCIIFFGFLFQKEKKLISNILLQMNGFKLTQLGAFEELRERREKVQFNQQKKHSYNEKKIV